MLRHVVPRHAGVARALSCRTPQVVANVLASGHSVDGILPAHADEDGLRAAGRGAGSAL